MYPLLDYIHHHSNIRSHNKKLKYLNLYFSFPSIYLLKPVFIFDVHLLEILPSGQIHPKVESIIIQTPTSPQNECSQTAIKRRATNRLKQIILIQH